jgi:hypothetical protein
VFLPCLQLPAFSMWRILHFFRAERIFKCSNQKSVCITYERSLVELLKRYDKIEAIFQASLKSGRYLFSHHGSSIAAPSHAKAIQQSSPQPHTIHNMCTHSSTHTHRHTLTAHRSYIPINTPVISSYMQIHSHLAVAMHAHSQSPTRSHPHNHYPIDTHVYSR